MLGGVLLTSSFAVGGQWIYFNPRLALDKFRPLRSLHGKLSLGTIRVFGAISVIHGRQRSCHASSRPLSEGSFRTRRAYRRRFLLAATITAWYLLKRERANA